MKEVKADFTEQHLETMRIPKRFWTLSRGDYFGDPKALSKCEEYVHNAQQQYDKGLGLFLVGGPDSGKTFLLTYVLRCLFLKKFETVYTTLEEVRNWVFDPKSSTVELLEPHFVAVDNCDSVDGGFKIALKRFVRYRRDNGLPFLIGTSLVKSEGEDLFENAYPEIAPQIYNLTHRVPCKVSEFRMNQYYSDLKK